MKELTRLQQCMIVDGWNHYANGTEKDVGTFAIGYSLARRVNEALGSLFSDEVAVDCPNITIEDFGNVEKAAKALESFDDYYESDPTQIVEYRSALRNTLLDIFKENING